MEELIRDGNGGGSRTADGQNVGILRRTMQVIIAVHQTGCPRQAWGVRIAIPSGRHRIESHGQMDRPSQLCCRNRQRPCALSWTVRPRPGGRNVGRRGRWSWCWRAPRHARHSTWSGSSKRRASRSADCIVDAEAERAPADPKVFTRMHFVYRIRGEGLNPRAGRARGQAVEGKILLGDADAGQDRRDQLRDQHQRRAA